MSKANQKSRGCGCSSIPISVLILLLGAGYGLFTQRHHLIQYLAQVIPPEMATLISVLNSPRIEPVALPSVNSEPKPSPNLQELVSSAEQKPWKQPAIRGIYLSRYAVTNNASEQTIRDRVRYYRSQGINTIIHGVWGNGCTMYKSKVMQQKLGYESCPNQFQEPWLDWLIDEAHQQRMEVHAYFEKGIKIDENSPIFDLAIDQRWLVAGVDKTHPGIDHYVLDVRVPEIASLLTDVVVEFVQKYPEIDAVQWDDYLGYHAELPGKGDRTAKLTSFVQTMIAQMKQANPAVSFDICHHNPYWAKTYFAADWENWDVDRVFIQVYNMDNFQDELKYVIANDGIAITERQFDRLPEIVNHPQIQSILLFPLEKPEPMAATYYRLINQTKN